MVPRGRVVAVAAGLSLLIVVCVAEASVLGTHIKDKDAPSLTVKVTPASTGVNEDPALTSGKAFRISGTVQDWEPDAGIQVPCGPEPAPRSCSLISIVMRQYSDAGGTTPVGIEIEVTSEATLDGGGGLTARPAVTFDAATVSTRALVEVEDSAGNRTARGSSLMEVDIIHPTIRSAVASGAAPGVERRIVVRFSEIVCGSTNVLDWTPTPSQVNAFGCTTAAELIYAVPAPGDQTLFYRPTPMSQRFRDGVGLPVEDGSVPIT